MTEFKEELAAAMELGRMKPRHLAIRLMIDTQTVGQWVRGERVPDADRQRDILAACAQKFDAVSWVVNELQRDIADRIEQFDVDLQTALLAKRAVTPALEDAARKVKATPRRKAR